jgi:hypothetical protein
VPVLVDGFGGGTGGGGGALAAVWAVLAEAVVALAVLVSCGVAASGPNSRALAARWRRRRSLALSRGCVAGVFGFWVAGAGGVAVVVRAAATAVVVGVGEAGAVAARCGGCARWAVRGVDG